MAELVFKLIIVGLSWAGIIHMILQIRRIIIPNRLAGIVGRRLLQGMIVIVFVSLIVILDLNPLEWVVVLSPGLFLYLSLYNKGLTEKGVIPYMIGGVARSSISKEYTFEETKDWLIMEEPKRLKIRFSTAKPTSDAKYIYFHLEDKDKITELLYKYKKHVEITKGKHL